MPPVEHWRAPRFATGCMWCPPFNNEVVNEGSAIRASDFCSGKCRVTAVDQRGLLKLPQVNADGPLGKSGITSETQYRRARRVAVGPGIVRKAQQDEPGDRFCHLLLLNRPCHCLDAQDHGTY